MTGRAIKTTAGAYLSQFASLHISVMTNILGSLKYRTEGDRYVFQTVSGCYALRVYEFATAALQSRMAALEETRRGRRKADHAVRCIRHCSDCQMVKVSFKDTWKLECGWKDSGYSLLSLMIYWYCVFMSLPEIQSGYPFRHATTIIINEVQKQTVSFWQNWLAPIPIWLNNVVLMQQIEVHKEGLLRDIEFDCSAIWTVFTWSGQLLSSHPAKNRQTVAVLSPSLDQKPSGSFGTFQFFASFRTQDFGSWLLNFEILPQKHTVLLSMFERPRCYLYITLKNTGGPRGRPSAGQLSRPQLRANPTTLAQGRQRRSRGRHGTPSRGLGPGVPGRKWRQLRLVPWFMAPFPLVQSEVPIEDLKKYWVIGHLGKWFHNLSPTSPDQLFVYGESLPKSQKLSWNAMIQSQFEPVSRIRYTCI